MYLPLLLWRYKSHLFTYAFLFEFKKLNCSACTSVWEIVIGWRQQVDLLWRSGSQPGKSDGTLKGFATFAIYINTWWQLKSLPITSEETHICEGVSESPLGLNGLLGFLPNNLQCSRTWPWWLNHDDPLISNTLKLSIRKFSLAPIIPKFLSSQCAVSKWL